MGYYQNTLTRLPLWALHRPGDFSKTIKYSVRYLLLTAVLHAFMKPLFQHQCNTGKPDAHVQSDSGNELMLLPRT